MATGDGNGWVDSGSGHRHWGRFGAAGLALLRTTPRPQVLLQLRAGWTHQGGSWGLVGGARDSHESLAEAALREAAEESGIDGLVLDPVPIDVDVHDVRCGAGDGTPATASTHYDVRFLVRCPAGATERVSAESSTLGWFHPDALPSPLASATTRQIPPALARLG